MSQMNIWRGLEGEVRAAGNVRLFDQAKARRAALANYATADAALAAFSDKSGASGPEHEQIVRALVAEQQSAPRALWASMLALAFRPMILRCARMLRSMSPGDAEQLALVAFIETLSDFAPGGCAIVSLYWATHRRIFRPLARERRRVADEIVFDEEEFIPTSPSPEALLHMKRLAQTVVRIVPRRRETPGTYVARVQGIKNGERRALPYARSGDLAELREGFLYSITPTGERT